MNKLSLLLCIAFLCSCDNTQLQAPTSPPVVEAVPADWSKAQAHGMQAKENFINNNRSAYEWFANFPFSEVDGTPYIILKLLPKLAPELWGSEENFLDVVGLFNDERQQNSPLPRGVGISRFSAGVVTDTIDYASFTCGACHIGRVRQDDGSYQYIDGGINAEFNIVKYRVKIYQTLEKVYAGATDAAEKGKRLNAAILSALAAAQAESEHYFYNDYVYSGVDFNSQYEAKQIDLFKAQADDLVAAFAKRSENNYTAYGALVKKNYEAISAEMIEGFPGMADATGISAGNGYVSLLEYPLGKWFASMVLPPAPGLTDFMAVWEQDKRKAHWNSDNSALIDGGGQWNGNIPIPIYRNLAAELTLGLGSKTDVRIAAFAETLLDGLPATVYPFDVDVELAKQGRELFVDNCAGCHRPHNGKVYSNLGVNLDRANVVGDLIASAARSGFTEICQPTTEVVLDGVTVKPCAEFEGVSLEGKKSVVMSPVRQHKGYNATALGGIWAQAPYLHTGSVPTLYHLLVPSERPVKFIKSRLDYDTDMVGFAWQMHVPEVIARRKEGYVFDSSIFATLTNAGHDTDVEDQGRHYRLNWNDDKAGAMAIVEYLKTL